MLPRTLLILMLFLAPQTVAAVYPGPAPCDGTLAACIDAAADGDTIQLATNGPIDEQVRALRGP